jgi:hypothetical protein
MQEEPTARQLSILSSQCTDREWVCLCQNYEFIEATSVSLEAATKVAEKILGRNFSVSAKSTSTDKEL